MIGYSFDVKAGIGKYLVDEQTVSGAVSNYVPGTWSGSPGEIRTGDI